MFLFRHISLLVQIFQIFSFTTPQTVCSPNSGGQHSTTIVCGNKLNFIKHKLGLFVACFTNIFGTGVSAHFTSNSQGIYCVSVETLKWRNTVKKIIICSKVTTTLMNWWILVNLWSWSGKDMHAACTVFYYWIMHCYHCIWLMGCGPWHFYQVNGTSNHRAGSILRG